MVIMVRDFCHYDFDSILQWAWCYQLFKAFAQCTVYMYMSLDMYMDIQ